MTRPGRRRKESSLQRCLTRPPQATVTLEVEAAAEDQPEAQTRLEAEYDQPVELVLIDGPIGGALGSFEKALVDLSRR